MKSIRYYAGIAALAGTIALSGCGKKDERINIIPNVDAADVYLSTDIIDEIGKKTKARQERERFDNYFEGSSILDNEDFINMDSMVITLNNKRGNYEAKCICEDYTYLLYFDKDKTDLISYLLEHTNCDTINIACVDDLELIEAISTSDKIKSLSIKFSAVDSLEPLSKMTNLEKLYIEICPNITDLAPIESLTNLKYVSLRGTKVSDVTPLSKLANLTGLNLRCNEITNPEVLSNLENLEVLTLAYNKIDDVKKLDAFVKKGLMEQDVAESVVETTTNHRKIFSTDNYEEDARVLTITYFDAQDEYFIDVRDENYDLLTYMFVDDPFYVYEITKDLVNCKTIMLLNCKDDDVTRHVYKEENFEYMTIYNCDFESLYFISDFKNLISLQIESCPNINYEFEKFGIFASSDLENLKYLSIKDTGIESLESFSRNKNLETVEAKYNQVSDYSFLTALENLDSADLTLDTEYADYDSFQYLINNNVKLKVNNMVVTSDLLERSIGYAEEQKEYKRQ